MSLLLRRRLPSSSATDINQRRRLLLHTTAVGAALGLGGVSMNAWTKSQAAARMIPLQSFNFLTLGQLSGKIDASLQAAHAKAEWKPAFPAYAPAAEALRAGSADITAGSTSAFLTATTPDKDLVVFGVDRNARRDQGIVATGASNIRSVTDLVGKRIAVNKGGTGEYLLRLALKQHGVPLEAVKPVYLSPGDAATAFLQGHIDAWATWELFLASAQAQPGARIVAYAADIGALNYPVYVATRRYAEQHAPIIKALYEGLQAEAAQGHKQPGRVAELYAAKGVPKDVVDILRQVPPSTLSPADATLQAELNTLADFYAESGLSAHRIDIAGTTFDITQAR